MTLVVSQGSGDLSGVQGQHPGTDIKEQHGCLAKIHTRLQFGCSACQWGGVGYAGWPPVLLECVENSGKPHRLLLPVSYGVRGIETSLVSGTYSPTYFNSIHLNLYSFE